MRLKNSLIVLLATSLLSGCGAGTKTTNPRSQLKAFPGNMDFGSVAVGSSKYQNGTLSAAGSSVTVSSASWDGGGFSLSGISFPVTIAAGQSVPFAVNFGPQIGGNSNGQVTFFSDAANSSAILSLSGTGTATVQHSVSLSWNPSSSQVAGYNVYRSSQFSGPFTKLNSVLDTATVFNDSSVVSGQTYYYAATSVDSNDVESTYSNVATAVIP
jgi:hypothetical protein